MNMNRRLHIMIHWQNKNVNLIQQNIHKYAREKSVTKVSQLSHNGSWAVLHINLIWNVVSDVLKTITK